MVKVLQTLKSKEVRVNVICLKSNEVKVRTITDLSSNSVKVTRYNTQERSQKLHVGGGLVHGAYSYSYLFAVSYGLT